MSNQKSILDDCTKLPVSRVIIPFNGARVYTDSYWIIVDECILLYKGHSVQCNVNKEIADKIRDRLYPGKEVRFLPLVYLESKD